MIYLDYNATTPVLPEVFESMRPYFVEKWGNPSSTYRFGSSLKKDISEAREKVAQLIGAKSSEIIFTSCATESNNMAILSAIKSKPNKRHLVTSQVEHSSVLNHCMELEKVGFTVTFLPVDREGLLNPLDLENAITEDTAIVSLMWANNETGVLFPVEKIAEICKSKGILFHCDAVQAVGKIPINAANTLFDYLSITGHKLYAPKGIGSLFVRKKAPISPFIIGGHQEHGNRGGTESVPLIVGLGKAAELSRKKLPDFVNKIRPLRDILENEILNCIKGAELNGHKDTRLPNTTNIMFHGIDSDALLLLLDKESICASSGSACLADSDEPSHVISSMKPSSKSSRESIRFSLGIFNTQEEMIIACDILQRSINHLGNS